MPKKTKHDILFELTSMQSEALVERIIHAMEKAKSFYKKEIVAACQPTAVDAVPYPVEAVIPAVETVIDTFIGTGMLIRNGKRLHIARYGKKVES